MLSKLNTVLWYLRQPKLYNHLIYQLYQYFYPHRKETTTDEATSWCKSRSKSTEEVLLTLIGSKDFKPIRDRYKNIFETASKVAAQTPVKMGGGSDTDLLFYLVQHLKPDVVIETGVAYGWSSLAILLSLQELQQGTLYSTDVPYAKLNNEDFVGVVVPVNLRDNWVLLRTPDRKGLKWILNHEKEIDLIHYDSDKSYRGRIWAYELLWRHLKKGGMLISDDINDNLGFKDFADGVMVDPFIVYYPEEDKYIGILIKP